jgi:hypothetical protein
MNGMLGPISDDRALTSEEHRLVRWMLEHGTPEAKAFLPQLERARVISRCRCGCASVDFAVTGDPLPSGAPFILADFLYGGTEDPLGAFVFQRDGFLGGIEVYGLASDAPRTLPEPEELRPFETSSA